MVESLNINFQSQEDSEIRMVIKQDQWNYGISSTMLATYIAYLNGWTDDTVDTVQIYDTEGYYDTNVYVYLKETFGYTLKASYGTLSSKTVVEDEETETILISGPTEILAEELTHPFSSIVSMKWIGDVYDNEGLIVENPQTLVSSGSPIDSWNITDEVYGLLEITMHYTRHEYVLNAPTMENTDDEFGAVIFAKYDKNFTWLKLSTPPDQEDLESTTTTRPTASHYSKIDETDYCTQELISTTFVPGRSAS